MKNFHFIKLLVLVTFVACQNKIDDSFAGYWVLEQEPDFLIRIDDGNHTIWAGVVPNKPTSIEEADKYIHDHGDPLFCSYEERDGAIYAEYWDKPFIIKKNGKVELTDAGSLWSGTLKKLWGLKQTADNQNGGSLNSYWYLDGYDFGILVKIQGGKVSMCDESPHKPKDIREAEEFLNAEFAYIQNAPMKIKGDVLYVYDKNGYYGNEKKGDYVPLYYIKGNALYWKYTDERFTELWGAESTGQNNNSPQNSKGYSTSSSDSFQFTSAMDVDAYLRGRFFNNAEGYTMSFTSSSEMAVNGTVITGAMSVIDFNSKQAILRGVSPYDGGTVRIRVDAAQGTITNIDKPSEVYRLSKTKSAKKGGKK